MTTLPAEISRHGKNMLWKLGLLQSTLSLYISDVLTEKVSTGHYMSFIANHSAL